MDRRCMVKQYVGEIYTLAPWGTPPQFRVFATGDDRWFLFDPLDLYGCSTCNQFPVLAATLRDDVRAGLSAGQTFTSAARNAWNAAQSAARFVRSQTF